MAWWEEIEPRSRAKVPVDQLAFDRENARFTPEKRPESDSDAAIIAHLASSADLGELIQSISASGYIDIEPLVVIGRDDQLVVLEGNRRLAALKVLLDPNLATQARVTAPDLTPDVTETLHEVAVYRVTDAAEARDLIGFKHINGPQAWDAYAKARYAADWLDIECKKRETEGSGLTLSDIARRMGDKHDTIHRIVTAAYVLKQAEDTRVFAVSDRAKKNFSFSHLYTALTYPEYRDFIGMPTLNRRANPSRNPIPEERLGELGRLLGWLFGSRSEDTEPEIKRQNPDLARLKRVLGDPRSKRVMLERNNLDEAIESTVSSSDRFEKNLVDADESLKRAQGALDGYDGRDETLLGIGKGVVDKARTIYRSMEIARQDMPSRETASDE